MTLQTVAVTGGNGRLGEAVLRELSDCGYETVNLARGKQREDVSDRYIRTDLLSAGNVYGALSESGADGVVHGGTIPAPGGNPGYEVYESNVMSTYLVLEAASALGLDTACIASSINVMGAVYQPEPMDVRYLPVDEDHPLTPRDPYAMGKRALEVTCDGFGRQDEAPRSISSLRFPWIATAEEQETRFRNSDRSIDGVESADYGGRDDLFSYIHIDDAARATRKAVEADLDGHECFWIVANDTTVDAPSEDVVERYYPDAEIREQLSGSQSLIDIGKAQALLDWRPQHTWRDE